MNKKEAIEELKKYVKDSIKFYEQSISSGFGEGSYYHQIFNEIIKAFEKSITLADLLGWEEGVEYKYDNGIYKLQNGNIYHQHGYVENLEWEETDYHIDFILRLQLATKVEKSKKDDLLDELQNLVSSERINEIIEELRELENE